MVIGIFDSVVATIVDIWSGGKVYLDNYTIPILALGYVLIRIWTDTFSMSLLCFNRANLTLFPVAIQALIAIILQVLFTQRLGVPGVYLGQIFSFLFTVSWILPLRFFQLSSK